MINSLLHHKLVIVVIIIIVIAGAWYGLSSSGAPAADSTLTSTSTDAGGDTEIVSTLLALQAITLSGAVFSNPAYATLQDFTTAIIPEPAGRPDPFAPITAQSAASPTQQSSAQIFKPAQ